MWFTNHFPLCEKNSSRKAWDTLCYATTLINRIKLIPNNLIRLKNMAQARLMIYSILAPGQQARLMIYRVSAAWPKLRPRLDWWFTAFWLPDNKLDWWFTGFRLPDQNCGPRLTDDLQPSGCLTHFVRGTQPNLDWWFTALRLHGDSRLNIIWKSKPKLSCWFTASGSLLSPKNNSFG